MQDFVDKDWSTKLIHTNLFTSQNEIKANACECLLGGDYHSLSGTGEFLVLKGLVHLQVGKVRRELILKLLVQGSFSKHLAAVRETNNLLMKALGMRALDQGNAVRVIYWRSPFYTCCSSLVFLPILSSLACLHYSLS